MLFAGQEIPKSPFEVNVDKALGDASKVTVKGPGVEPVGNIANKPTYFDIYTAGKSSRTQEEKSLFKMFLHTEVVFLWRINIDIKKNHHCRCRYRRRDSHDQRSSGPAEHCGGDDGG